jgi:hypothetical protein
MHNDAVSADAHEERGRNTIARAMLGGIVLAYVVSGLALYAIVSIVV